MKFPIKILLVAALPLILAANKPAKQCLGGLRQALIEGGFDAPLICSEDATFTLIGRTAGAGYAIYDYRYRFKAAVVYHGGQRLMIFRGGKYLGHYVLPPRVKVAVQGKYVVLQGDSVPGKVRLDFSKAPPKNILVNGEPEIFSPAQPLSKLR